MLMTNELHGFNFPRLTASYIFNDHSEIASTTTTYNHTIAFTTDNVRSSIVVVCIAMACPLGNRDISSVTVDQGGTNVSCTKVTETNSGNDFDTVEVWQCVYKGTGSKTVRVTLSGNGTATGISVFSLYDLISTTVQSVGFQGSNNSTTATASCNQVNSGLVIAAFSKTGSSDMVFSTSGALAPTETNEDTFTGTKKMQTGALIAPATVSSVSITTTWTTANNGRGCVACWR